MNKQLIIEIAESFKKALTVFIDSLRDAPELPEDQSVSTETDNISDTGNTVVPADYSENIELDSRGNPWDPRIHSSSKTKIKDGSWRLRRNITKVEAEKIQKSSENKQPIAPETTVPNDPPRSEILPKSEMPPAPGISSGPEMPPKPGIPPAPKMFPKPPISVEWTFASFMKAIGMHQPPIDMPTILKACEDCGINDGLNELAVETDLTRIGEVAAALGLKN